MDRPTAAILLAAGSSTRMGQTKQLLPLSGRPVIIHCLETIIKAGIQEIVVVLGQSSDEAAALLADLPVRVVFNRDNKSDMAGSAVLGLQSTDASATGVFISLCDHPLVSSETYRKLLDMHEKEPDKILVPCHDEKRGHPTLFPMAAIKELSGGKTLREIINADRGRVLFVPVTDIGVVLDMDTKEDYETIVRLSGEDRA